MASTQTGIYPDPTGLLDIIRIYALADGYTVNLWDAEGLGYRLHLQKTIGPRTVYFNFRSLFNEVGQVDLYGIICNASTGFDSGDGAMVQPGAPAYYGGVRCGDNKAYRIISDTEHLSFANIDADDEQMLCVCPATKDCYGYFTNMAFSGATALPDRLLRDEGSSCAMLMADGATWAPLQGRFGSGAEYIRSVLEDEPSVDKGLAMSILTYSPNDNTAIPSMAPMAIFVGEYDSYYRHHSGPDSIMFVNAKFMNNGDTFIVNSKTYVVYSPNTPSPDYGIALEID